MNLHGKDSSNKPVKAGDCVRFRGRIFIIQGFVPGGRYGSQRVIFTEAVAFTTEVPDEISIDRIVLNEAPREK